MIWDVFISHASYLKSEDYYEPFDTLMQGIKEHLKYQLDYDVKLYTSK